MTPRMTGAGLHQGVKGFHARVTSRDGSLHTPVAQVWPMRNRHGLLRAVGDVHKNVPMIQTVWFRSRNTVFCTLYFPYHFTLLQAKAATVGKCSIAAIQVKHEYIRLLHQHHRDLPTSTIARVVVPAGDTNAVFPTDTCRIRSVHIWFIYRS